MGEPGRRTPQRPLADSYRLPDRIVGGRTPAEPVVHPCHHLGILLQEESSRQPERQSAGADRIDGAGSCCIVWNRAGYRENRRLVRTAVCQRFRLPVQYRRNRLYDNSGGKHHLGRIRKLHSEEPQTHEHLISDHRGTAGYPLLRTRMEQRADWHHRACRSCNLSLR